MKYIKLNDFLQKAPNPFICGAFLSRIMEETENGHKYFYAYSYYKKIDFIDKKTFNFNEYVYEYNKQLNIISGGSNWEIVKVTDTYAELRFRILCDIKNYNKTNLYDFFYIKSTTSDWAMDSEQNESKRDFIRGFIELRGSIDRTRKYISQDYFYSSRKELTKSKLLTDIMNIDIYYANFNARELQPQHVSGKAKRNSQFRINLYYYASEIGFINKYKATIFEKAYNNKTAREKDGIIYYTTNIPIPKKADATFIAYLNYYSNNIYNKALTPSLLKELRKALGFSDGVINPKNRNRFITTAFDSICDDRCSLCGTEKTYTKNNGRQYFEIHHVVSRANGPEMDNIGNLVKLCPTCHRMMKKGAAPKNIQINACKKIIEEHNEIYEFASVILDEDDIDILACKIQESLK